MFFSSGSARTRTIADAKGCQGEYAKGALLRREALCALLLPLLFWSCISNSSSKSNAGSTPPARRHGASALQLAQLQSGIHFPVPRRQMPYGALPYATFCKNILPLNSITQ